MLTSGQGADLITDFNIDEDIIVLNNGVTYQQLTIVQGNIGTEIQFNNELLATLAEVEIELVTQDIFSGF